MNKNKVSAVYKIVNEVTNECYVGSSRDVKHRWALHRCPSTWKEHPNSPLYCDMQKYGLGCFRFQILTPVMPEYLKQVEQEFIEMLEPVYNDRRSKGFDVGRQKKRQKKASKKYNNQLCSYNGETLTFHALVQRLSKAGVEHPALEAKKYLLTPQ